MRDESFVLRCVRAFARGLTEGLLDVGADVVSGGVSVGGVVGAVESSSGVISEVTSGSSMAGREVVCEGEGSDGSGGVDSGADVIEERDVQQVDPPFDPKEFEQMLNGGLPNGYYDPQDDSEVRPRWYR